MDSTVGTQAGAVYLYAYSGGSWSLNATLLPSALSTPEFFGWSVDLWDDTLVVGEQTVWTQIGSIGPVEQDTNRFGESVAVSGWLACGAPEDDEILDGTYKIDVGSVYVDEFWSPSP